ncbi:hypothetical protein AB0M44_47555 [Streptosporangium subroseum]|uniref:hypothetical protein n=1 Tax=Streptosporangium subroseum TaxID=106412 RepID=UPI00342F9667
MIRHAIKIASIALIAPLTGITLLSSTPALAASEGTPFSTFKVKATATKQVQPGGKIVYKVVGTNAGPYNLGARHYNVVFQLPKGLDAFKVKSFGPKEEDACAPEKGFVYCTVNKPIPVGSSISYRFEVKAGSEAKGTLKAILGVMSFDVPTGMQDMNEKEAERIGGIPTWGFGDTVTTKVVR